MWAKRVAIIFYFVLRKQSYYNKHICILKSNIQFTLFFRLMCTESDKCIKLVSMSGLSGIYCLQLKLKENNMLDLFQNIRLHLSKVFFLFTTNYIILNNGILKSNYSIFPWSKGYITQYAPQGVYGVNINENNEVNISLMTGCDE